MQVSQDTSSATIASSNRNWWMRFLLWRERHISEKATVLILAVVVGALSGFAALLLKALIAFVANLLTAHVSITTGNYMYLLWPVLGILITMLFVKYVVRDNISHGVTRVLRAISQNKSRLKPHNTWTSLLASGITIGFGGSVGAEGPIVATGAAIGSNLGSALRLSPRVLMIMVGCGAAAGIAGIFKAPIAGLLFTIEVLMLDLTAGSVMPLMLASISGAVVAYVFTGYDLEFFFSQSEPFTTSRIPYVIILGVFCGFVSLYFTKVMNAMETMLSRVHNRWVKLVIGGVILSSLIFFFPPLYGEGYNTINILLRGDVSLIFDGSPFYPFHQSITFTALFIVLLMLSKVFATSATNGCGGVGGTFAPSLFVGCMAGFFFAFLLNQIGITGGDLSTKNFALMGMAGVMSAVMHAPLMAIFLTAEMTGGYDLFLPLLIVSVISYGTIRLFLPFSIYSMRLAQRGELLTHQKDRTVLTLLKLPSVIETDFTQVHPDMSLKQMVEAIAQSRRNVFPVTNRDTGRLLGVVYLDDIRNIMFRPDLYRKMTVERFMTSPPARIVTGMPMQAVMDTFDRTAAWYLPVVDRDRKYVGFVSKSRILLSYRQVLKHFTDD